MSIDAKTSIENTKFYLQRESIRKDNNKNFSTCKNVHHRLVVLSEKEMGLPLKDDMSY